MGTTNNKPAPPSQPFQKAPYEKKSLADSQSYQEVPYEEESLANTSIKRVIWHDPNVNNDENLSYSRDVFQNVELERSTDFAKAADFLKKTAGTWIVISSGKNGSELIPLIHDLPNVSGIIIFCRNPEDHKPWALKYRKVQAIVTHITQVQKDLQVIFKRQLLAGALELGGPDAIGGIQNAFNHVVYGAKEKELDPVDVYCHSDFSENMQFTAIANMFLNECSVSPNFVLEELIKLNPEEKAIITKEFEKRWEDDGLKAIIYLYSTNYLYGPFNKVFSQQKYHKLAYTLTTCMKELAARPKLAVDSKTALFRGMQKKKHGDTYIINNVFFWPAFTSTSSCDLVAQAFSGNEGIVFEIKLSEKRPYPNIRLENGWSRFSCEKEVLLLPYFTFKVISKENRGNTLWIVIEQDLVDNFLVITQKQFTSYWKDIIHSKIRPGFEEIFQRLYETIEKFAFNDFIWREKSDFTFVEELKAILSLSQIALNPSHVISFWFQRFHGEICQRLEVVFEEKEKEWTQSKQSKQKDIFKTVYLILLSKASDKEFFKDTYGLLFEIFIYQLLPSLAQMPEPLEREPVQFIIQRVLTQMEPAWHLAKEATKMQLKVEIEKAMASIERQLLKYYLKKNMTEDNSDKLEEVKRIEESLKQVEYELNTFLKTLDSPEVRELKCQLEAHYRWLEDLKVAWNPYFEIRFLKQSQVMIISHPRDLNDSHLVLSDMLGQLDHEFRSHDKNINQLTIKFCSEDAKIKDSLERLVKHLSKFNHELQSLTLNLYKCDYITDAALDLSACIDKHKTLQHLVLEFNYCANITDKGLFAVAAYLRHLSALSHLTLDFDGCDKITDVGFSRLLESISKRSETLRELMLSFKGCMNISDQGMKQLAVSLSQLPSALQQLTLSFDSCLKITETAFRELSTSIIKHSQTLQQLTLKFTGWEIVHKGPLHSIMIEPEIAAQFEEFAHMISDAVSKLDYTEFFVCFEHTFLSLLKRKQDTLPSEKTELANDWIRKINLRYCKALEVACYEQGRNCFINSKAIHRDFKNFWSFCLEHFDISPISVKIFTPLIEQIASKIPWVCFELDKEFVDSVIQKILAEMPLGLCLAKEAISLQLKVQIEKLKPRIKRKLESHYLLNNDVKLEAVETQKIEESLQKVISKLNAENEFGRSWVEELQVKWEDFFYIEAELLPKVEIISINCSKFGDLIRELGQGFKSHNQKVSELIIDFSRTPKLEGVDIVHIAKSLSEFNYELQSLTLNFNGCYYITDAAPDLSACISKHKTLQHLALHFNRCTKIRDQGLFALAKDIKRLSSLSHLTLGFDGCKEITDSGLIHLATSLSQLPSALQQLTLSFDPCVKFTETAFSQLSTSILKHSQTLQELALRFGEWEIVHEGPIHSMIEPEIAARFEEFIHMIYAEVSRFDFTKFIWFYEYDFFSLQILKQDPLPSQKIKLANDWIRKTNLRFCKALEEACYEQGRNCFINSKAIHRDFKNFWSLCLEDFDISPISMKIFTPLIKQFVSIVPTITFRALDKESVDLRMRKILQSACCLAKEAMSLQLKVQIEKAKPRIKRKLESRYLMNNDTVKLEPAETQTIEESLEEAINKLNDYYLNVKPPVGNQNEENGFDPSWVEELQVKWENFFYIEVELLPKVEIISTEYPDNENCSKFEDLIRELGQGFRSRNQTVSELVIDFSRTPTLKDTDVVHISKSLSEFDHELQSLTLNFNGCYNITDAALDFSTCISKHKTLQHLALHFNRCTKITNAGLSELARISEYNQTLRHLVLQLNYCAKITDEGFFALGANIKHLSALSHLTLGFDGCKEITDGGLSRLFESISKHSETLRALILGFEDCYQVTDLGLSHIGTWIGNHTSNLQTLMINFSSMSNINITDKGLIELASSISMHSSNLQRLGLRFNGCKRITDRGLCHLASTLSKPGYTLQQLALSFDWCSNLTDAGLCELSASLRNHSQTLQELTLDFVEWGITDAAVTHLGETISQHCIELLKLNIRFRYCDGVSEIGAEKLITGISQHNHMLKYATLVFGRCEFIGYERLKELAKNVGKLKHGRFEISPWPVKTLTWEKFLN